MSVGGPIGTIYAEIDLDSSRYIKSQKQLYKDATTTTLNIESNFKKLGIRSSAEMDLMRAKITNAYNMIAHSSKSTANDILRAERAKTEQLKQLADEQFGHQTSLLGQLKEHWLGIAASAYAAYRAIQGIVRMVSRDIQLYMKQEQAERGLKQAMISMKRYSDEAYVALLRQASAMQRLTGIGDELTISGQKMLMTFKQIPDELMGRTTRAMLDLAALMGGDVNQAALQLGKAAMGLTGELRRVGITVDAQTYKLEGFAGVLRQVEEQVGKQAVAVAQGSGQWKILGSAIGDAGEALGGFFSELMINSGSLRSATIALEMFTDAMNSVRSDPLMQLKNNIQEMERLQKALTNARAQLRAFQEQPATGWFADLINAKAIKSATFEIKSLEEQISILATKIPKAKKSFEEFAQELLDSIDPLKELKKRMEEMSKPFTQNILSPDYQKAKDEILDLIDKFTKSDYELKVKALNEQFARYRGILGDLPELVKAYELSLADIDKRYGKIPEATKQILPLPSGKLSEFKSGMDLTFTQFSGFLTFDTEVEQKAEKAIKKIENRWDSFSDYAGNSFINAMVADSDLWLKYLSQEFQRTFLQETMGTQMKSMMKKIFGEEGFFQTTTLGKMFGVKGDLAGVALGDILGAGALGYGLGGVGGGLGAAGGFMAGSKFLTGGAFAEGGKLAGLGGPIGMIAGGLLGGLLGGGGLFSKEPEIDWFKAMIDQLNAEWEQRQEELSRSISNTLQNAISEGFRAGYESGGYQDFINAFKKDLGSSIVDAFAQIMAADALKPLMNLFEPAFKKVAEYINPEKLLAAEMAALKSPQGFGTYSSMLNLWQARPESVVTYEGVTHTGEQWLKLYEQSKLTLQDIFETFPGGTEFQTALDDIKPVWELTNEYLLAINDTLGLNTEALGQNTDAILGPVNAYLNQLAQLDTGPTSLAYLENQRAGLWQQAMMNPDQFQPYSSFMGSGGYIKLQQGLGGFDIAGERQAVENIPWVQEARQPITVNVIVDGEVIKSEVYDALDDPDVVQRIVTRTGKYF